MADHGVHLKFSRGMIVVNAKVNSISVPKTN